MLLVSFRWFATRFVPVPNPRKQALLVVGALLLAAGCGGGAKAKEQTVQGPGYFFSAPIGWTVTRKGAEVQAAQGTQLVSVTRFPLVRAFRPSLWSKVLPELDRAAETLATQQQGTVTDRATVTIAGLRARRYEVAYARDGKQLIERIAFVLRRKTEHLLLCRYERGGDTRACDGLLATFRLT
jgi:hypothetical protein